MQEQRGRRKLPHMALGPSGLIGLRVELGVPLDDEEAEDEATNGSGQERDE